jgi:CRISPR-associated protein Cmr4
MSNYLTYLYLLTPLHTGGSANEGNLMGIAREVHTEFPYLPASSLRGKIRATLEQSLPLEQRSEVDSLFGRKIESKQPLTEGEVWFADATLLLFPVASFSHQFVWLTCPLWLNRWNRWLRDAELTTLIQTWNEKLNHGTVKAISSIATSPQLYLQGAVLEAQDIELIPTKAACWSAFEQLPSSNDILDLKHKLVIVSDADCGTFVEMGLQREVRIALKTNSKIAADGSFRSEEAIPSEAVLFFPWGLKPEKNVDPSQHARQVLQQILNQRLQFGGLEGLGRGWTESGTIKLKMQSEVV